ncbi:hypothetical protein RJ640_029950 [Escallonia rubra]|uniref:F-box domain-containing protein n=1 Tax=Escallonia rubra TaxID=112253 RepID=A0AA88RXV6_9ASTE|nr:hypothetical protein RJ640_029950 [Escallonia rubra]
MGAKGGCSKYLHADEKMLPTQHQQLIPGLPDDIGLECLLRVPFQFHFHMKFVCHCWHSLISHPSFLHQRRRSPHAELLLCLVQALPPSTHSSSETCSRDEHNCSVTTLTEEGENTEAVEEYDDKRHNLLRAPPPLYGLSVYNATKHSWQRIVLSNCRRGEIQLKIPMFCHCLVLPSTGKLLLIGGWDPDTLEAVHDVYILDFSSRQWRKGAPMLTARSFFACASVGHSTVYVAGGHDHHKTALQSAEVYDTVADEWRMLPPMGEERDECQGLSWPGDSSGGFLVVSGYGTESPGQFRSDAEYYDPNTESWSRVEAVWPFPNASPRAIATTVSNSGHDWSLFVAGDQEALVREKSKNKDDGVNYEQTMVTLPRGFSTSQSSPCVTTVGLKNGRRMIYVTGSSSSPASECNAIDGGGRSGVYSLEMEESSSSEGSRSSSCKWERIDTPADFSGFAYSASCLYI